MTVQVDTLRWLVFVVTLAVIAGVAWAAFDFVMGPRSELTRALPDPLAFVVDARDDDRLDSGKIDGVVTEFIKVKPQPPKAAEPVVRDVVRAGGPLESGWEPVCVTTVFGNEYVSLREKQETPSRTATRGGSARRTRTSRRAQRSQPVRTRFVELGSEFLVDGKAYVGVACVADDPIQFTYREGSREFTILGPTIDTQIAKRDGSYYWDGIPTDPDELKRRGMEGKERVYADPDEGAPEESEAKPDADAARKAAEARKEADDASKKAEPEQEAEADKEGG